MIEMIVLIGLIVWIVGDFIMLFGVETLNDIVERIGIFVALSGFLFVVATVIYAQV